MIGGRLTMRALVERNQTVAEDGWGQPAAPSFQSIGDPLPCFIWSASSRELIDSEKSAMLEDMRGLFALGADIREGDEIASVTDRRGAEVIPGRLQVEGPVQRKHTHQEASLRRVG